MRDLAQIANTPDVELCAAAAMLHVHESAKVVDHDAVRELQDKLEVREVQKTVEVIQRLDPVFEEEVNGSQW